MMKRVSATNEEVRNLIKLIKLTELYETNQDTRDYVETISTKLKQ